VPEERRVESGVLESVRPPYSPPFALHSPLFRV